MAIEDLGALLAGGASSDPGPAFAAFEKLRKKRRAEMVQAYTRAAGRA